MEHRDPDTDPILWESRRLVAQRLVEGHEALLQSVFEAAGDYFLRISGRPEPDADAAKRELAACAAAPGRDVALLVATASGEPVGAMGWWCGNPEPDVTLLGMVLIVPSRRGAGLAREALHGLEGWLGAGPTDRLRTAVAAANYAEQKFLRALGFVQLPIREHTALGLGGSHLALYEKPIR